MNHVKCNYLEKNKLLIMLEIVGAGLGLLISVTISYVYFYHIRFHTNYQ